MSIRLNPLNDYLFMKTMGEKGDEEQLLSFLNAVLKPTADKLVSVEIIENKMLPAEVIRNKTCILDLRARTNDGAPASQSWQHEQAQPVLRRPRICRQH